MRASFVCFKKVGKVGKALSVKCSLRVRMRVVSRIKYYKNIKIIPRHTTCLPSYRHKAFPTQISRKLLSDSADHPRGGCLHGPVRTSMSPAEKQYFNRLNFNAL